MKMIDKILNRVVGRTVGTSLLLLLASCSSEEILTEPTPVPDQEQNGSESGKYYISLNLSQPDVTGSRAGSQTGENYYSTGQEYGQEWENAVEKVVLILANPQNDIVYTSVEITGYGITKSTANDYTYTVQSELNTEEVEAMISNRFGGTLEEVPVKVYVVCNPPEDYAKPEKDATSVQKVMTTTSYEDKKKYGYFPEVSEGTTTYHPFLMTNGDYLNPTEDENKGTVNDKYVSTIVVSELMQSSPRNPYPLKKNGSTTETMSVDVQRALARIDMTPSIPLYYFTEQGEYMGHFTQEEMDNRKWKISVDIEYIGIVNVSRNFNLFKETGPSPMGSVKGTDWGYFWNEYQDRYVRDPKYSDKVNLLSASTYNSKTDLFLNNVFDSEYLRNPKNYDSQNEDAIPGLPFAFYDNMQNPANTDEDIHEDDYVIWKYCIPNSIEEADNQKAGISTGIVFVARLNFGDGGLREGTERRAEDEPEELNPTPIYFWRGVPIGTNYELQGIVNGANKSTNAQKTAMAEAYKKAYREAKGTEWDITLGPTALDAVGTTWQNFRNISDWGSIGDESLSPQQKLELKKKHYKVFNIVPDKTLAQKMLDNGFSIYYPFDPQGDGYSEYMCYYYIWIKHNDNNIPLEMGPMEFGVVRNNIYQIAVNDIKKVGHPIPAPGDDPIPTDPDALVPSEDDETVDPYITFTCKILDWNLRKDEKVTLY